LTCRESGTNKDGVTFLCPHCRQRRLGIQFANPVGGQATPPMTQKEKRLHIHELRTFDIGMSTVWQRTGETFDDLTLSPSVDASASGHWHGHVTNGEVK
jgi:hypothetical protein